MITIPGCGHAPRCTFPNSSHSSTKFFSAKLVTSGAVSRSDFGGAQRRFGQPVAVKVQVRWRFICTASASRTRKTASLCPALREWCAALLRRQFALPRRLFAFTSLASSGGFESRTSLRVAQIRTQLERRWHHILKPRIAPLRVGTSDTVPRTSGAGSRTTRDPSDSPLSSEMAHRFHLPCALCAVQTWARCSASQVIAAATLPPR